MTLREIQDAAQLLLVENRSERVRRRVHDNHPRAISDESLELLQVWSEVMLWPKRIRHRLCLQKAGIHRERGVPGVGNENFVSGAEQQAHRLEQALCRAERHPYLLDIDVEGIVPCKFFYNCLTEPRNTGIGRVVCEVGRPGGCPSLENVWRHRSVGLTYCQHDHIVELQCNLKDVADTRRRYGSNMARKRWHGFRLAPLSRHSA